MNWINKRLQINEGSYGILMINAHVNDAHYSTGFELTTYSYTEGGGKHSHNKFTLTPKDSIKFANALYEYRTPKNDTIVLKQKHEIRGELFLKRENGKMILTIGNYAGGVVCLDKGQAKKLAGYVYYWFGQHLIGLKKVKIPANVKNKLDVNDLEANNP